MDFTLSVTRRGVGRTKSSVEVHYSFEIRSALDFQNDVKE